MFWQSSEIGGRTPTLLLQVTVPCKELDSKNLNFEGDLTVGSTDILRLGRWWRWEMWEIERSAGVEEKTQWPKVEESSPFL